jgi:hypothetical protein
MENMALPGLERLMEVCQRLNLGLETSPPSREPLKAGHLLEGFPLTRYWRVSIPAWDTRLLPRRWEDWDSLAPMIRKTG